MTTQDDKPNSPQDDARTQLRPTVQDWKLTSKGPDQAGDVFTIQGEMSVGREGCDITLTGGHVSRRHARLLLEDGALRVEDLGSTNGTFVNDEKVESSALKPGDEVRFDTEIFLVEGPPPPAPAEDNKTVLRPAAPEPEPSKATTVSGTGKKTKGKKKAAGKKTGAGAESGNGRKADAEKPAEAPKAAEGEKPAGPEKPEEAKPAAEQKPEAKPDKPVESGSAEEPGTEEESRRAWYERETPNMTRKVESSDLRDHLAEGGTQIVRGVKEVEMPSLIGTTGDWAGHVINLEKETMTIGRSDTDIILDEPSVSTKHAQVVRDGERWKVVDLMSANGVYVNGKKTQVAFLSSGDAVRFGRLELRFVTDSTQVSSRSAPEQEELITGSAASTGGGSSWLYLAIGFVVIAVAAGAFLLFAG